MPMISVVIPTYQRRESLLRELRALARQTLPPRSFEVIVSIDGSTDGTREALESFSTPYRLVVVDGPNRGRATACNRGIRAAGGELLVLLDDDMEPAPGFLDAHWRAARGDPARGVMGAVPVRIEPSAPPAVRHLGARFNGHLANLARPDYVPRLSDFYSGNFSVRRDVLLDVGLFDEDFVLYGNEDLELSLRLTRAGVRFSYCAEALAYQGNDKDFAALARDKIAEGRTAVLLARKHPDALDGLKLGSFAEGPASLLRIRALLLRLGRSWDALPEWLIRLEGLAASLGLPGSRRIYEPLLGLFYWFGARAALEELRGTGTDPGPLARLADELR
jgi:GT2 family glycosyltransferase